MKKKVSKNDGFSLVELMVVIGIIGVLATIAIPAFATYRDKATLRRVASDLVTFGEAFELYMIDRGCYPPDSHDEAPNHLINGYEMEKSLSVQAWLQTPPWGGFYNWEGPNGYPYAGISLFGTTADDTVMTSLDQMMDDGDLNTGDFKKTANGRYTFIVDHNPTAACS